MNINLVRTFLALIDMRSFNKAAERLFVTQSTVTMRINALEQLLGKKLFTRNKIGVELTVAGHKFQPHAELLMQTWQHAKHELALPSDLTVLFSVGCDPALWEGLADEWFSDVRTRMPSVALWVDVTQSRLALERLAQGQLEAALLYEPRPRHGIEIERLYDEKLILVSTEPRRAVRWHPAYVYIEWGEDFHIQHSAIQPVEITPPVTFTDGHAALKFVLRLGGSAYFPIRQVGPLIDAGKLFVVQDAGPMIRSVYVAYSGGIKESKWFQQALALLRTRALDQERLNDDLPYITREAAVAKASDSGRAAPMKPRPRKPRPRKSAPAKPARAAGTRGTGARR